jgi:hypothetical protein
VATEATATFERAALILIKDTQKREHLLFRQVLSMSFQSEFQSPTHPPPTGHGSTGGIELTNGRHQRAPPESRR